MNRDRFSAITGKYSGLRVAVAGDFCLDRYLEIDPTKREVSLETGLPVHNVVKVRAQPGGAGTITNNLSALGIQTIFPIGFTGEDGEGFELRRALIKTPGLHLEHFIQSSERQTFCYCKPLHVVANEPPRELSRLDQKNWTPTPASLEKRLGESMLSIVDELDAMILLSQVDEAGTGVLTSQVLRAFQEGVKGKRKPFILADSRHGLHGFPPLAFKMNERELHSFTGRSAGSEVPTVGSEAASVAKTNGHPVFVTLAERGMVAASPEGRVDHLPAHPTRGPIDVVGAGDAVTANLAAAIAAGASLREAIVLASAAASVVIHQLGSTGTASVAQIQERLFSR